MEGVAVYRALLTLSGAEPKELGHGRSQIKVVIEPDDRACWSYRLRIAEFNVEPASDVETLPVKLRSTANVKNTGSEMDDFLHFILATAVEHGLMIANHLHRNQVRRTCD